MEILEELAARAERQPPPRGSGPYGYVHTRGRHLTTAQTTSGRLLDARFHDTDREFWVAADGNGRIAETRGGRPSRANGVYGPGGLSPDPLAGIAAGVDPVPRLRRSRAPDPVGWIEDITDLWQRRPVPPAVQGAVLRHLANLPGVRLDETTDRAGRAGLAVSADDPPARGEWRTRHVLVLDPATGMLLTAEQVALQRGDAPIGMPDPHSHTTWVSTGYVAGLHARP